MLRLSYALALIGALHAGYARAADLLQTYFEALANDATYAAARAARDSGLENLPQGLAQILPALSATAFTQYGNADVGVGGAPSDQRQGNSNGYTVTLTQPLFNWQAFQSYQEAGFKAAQAEAVFDQATQDLMVRVA